MKIRKWDSVIIISWTRKNKWKIWTVQKVFPTEQKIIVEWVNIVTRHIKKTATAAWQKVQFEKPIHVSNVSLVCPFTEKPTRIGFVFKGDKKFRFSKKAVKELGKTDLEAII